MSVYSVWPSAACLLLFFLAASTRLFKAADTPPDAGGPRLSALDGLRGFLALAVFFHHAVISYRYWQTGEWQVPPSRFYTLLGPIGVSMFFMITGFLFWGKLIRAEGKPGWVQLYIGRVFRIGPLYWCAIAWMLALVAVKTRLHLHESALRVLSESARWSAMGMFWPLNVNGFSKTNELLAGVSWSLQYEWAFYGSLLITGLLIRVRMNDLLLSAGGLVFTSAYLFIRQPVSAAMPVAVGMELFLIGMTCASLRKRRLAPPLPDWLASVVTLACVATILLRYRSASSVGPCLLLGIAFFLISSECTLFGILSARAARRLGDISYGIYLLQGLVLSCVAMLPGVRIFSAASPYAHWLIMAAAGLCLMAVSTAAHAYIERPGIALGKQVIARLFPKPIVTPKARAARA